MPIRSNALLALLALSVLALTGLPPHSARAADAAGHCFRIERATAFSPRGEVYVDVAVSCDESDFESSDSVGVYVELLLSDLPALAEEVRVYAGDPMGRETVVFEDLDLAAGDPVLIRLVRFGEILDLKSLLAR